MNSNGAGRVGFRFGVMVGLALATLLAPGAAWAHNAGRVELLVTELGFSPGTNGDVMVHADLVDRDSGARAAGFAVVVSATGENGAAAGPVTLTDPAGKGHYEGMLAAGPGSWTVTARAEQGTSALPALGSTRTATLKVDPAGALSNGGSHGGGSNTGVWVSLAAAVVVLAAGGALFLTRRSSGAAAPMGQRV